MPNVVCLFVAFIVKYARDGPCMIGLIKVFYSFHIDDVPIFALLNFIIPYYGNVSE